MNIYEKLLKVQTELKAPKSQYNSFGKYNYRNAEDILEAVKPLQAAVNALTLLSDEISLTGERYYVTATAKFIDVESGETIEVKANAREELDKKGMDASQVTGASSSYARKYALNGLFAIDDTKDSDATNIGDNGAKKPSEQPKPTGWSSDLPFPEIKPTDGREKIISVILGGNKEYIDRLKAKTENLYGVSDFNKLNDVQFKAVTGLANKFMEKVGEKNE